MKGPTSKELDSLTDALLIERFTEGRDEDAFGELVRRHGPMVMCACRRRLKDEHDCQDAFQATFLTLVTKAKWIRQKSSVGGWLQRVAVRIAIDLQRAKRRRPTNTDEVDVKVATAVNDETTLMIEEELARLPAKYRNAIVLCHLEGYKSSEAAKQLGVPRNTLNSWLVRGRKLLLSRLVKQGVVLSAGGVISGVAGLSSSVTVEASLIQETSRAASLYAAGYPAASTAAVTLAKATITTMLLTKLSSVASICLLAIASLVGVQQSAAQAATYFTETFSDTSLTDGSPVTWEQYFGRGELAFSSGLELSNLTSKEIDFRAVTDPISDVSIKAEMSIDSGEGIGVFARQELVSVTDTGTAVKSVGAGYNPAGDIAIWSNDNDDPSVIPTENFFLTKRTGWNLAGRTVTIEFDVIGRDVSLLVWPSDLDRSNGQELIGRLPDSVPDVGDIGFFFAANNARDVGAFQSFALVPEPSTSTASFGVAAVFLGLLLRPSKRR